MASVTFKIRPEYSKKNDGNAIRMNYQHLSETFNVHTQVFIKKEYWDSKNYCQMAGTPGAAQANAQLEIMRQKMNKLILMLESGGVEPYVKTIKRHWSQGKIGDTMLTDLREFINRKSALGLSDSTISQLGMMEYGLLQMQSSFKLVYAEMTFEFCEKYIEGLLTGELCKKGKPVSNATLKILVSHLKSFLRDMRRRGKHNNSKYDLFMDIVKEYTRNTTFNKIILFDKEFARIAALKKEDLTPHHYMVQQSFLFLRETGLRISDIHLPYSCIDFDSRAINPLTIKRLKGVRIPLTPKALKIIKRVREHTGTQRGLFPKIPIDYNKALRSLAKKAKLDREVESVSISGRDVTKLQRPLCEAISSHMARRSFASQYMAKGGNIKHLQEILGHSTLGTTERYVVMLPGKMKEHEEEKRQVMER